MGKGILVRGAQGRGMGHDRTRLTIKWGKWVLPAEAALPGAKMDRYRAALRCGKCAADGLPCGMGQMGFACESGASRRKNGLLPGGLAMRQTRCGRPAVWQRVRLWERLPGAVSGKRGRFSATGRGRAGANRSQAAQRQQRVGDIKMGRARTTGPATGHFSFSSTRAFASAITDGSGRWMPVSGSQCSLTTSRLVA